MNDIRGGHLIEIIHFDEMISPAIEDEPILGGDRLIFAGQIDEILESLSSTSFIH